MYEVNIISYDYIIERIETFRITSAFDILVTFYNWYYPHNGVTNTTIKRSRFELTKIQYDVGTTLPWVPQSARGLEKAQHVEESRRVVKWPVSDALKQ